MCFPCKASDLPSGARQCRCKGQLNGNRIVLALHSNYINACLIHNSHMLIGLPKVIDYKSHTLKGHMCQLTLLFSAT